MHFDSLPASELELESIGALAYGLYLHRALSGRRNIATPLVSVFTPTYRTGERIERTYRSLQDQTYTNWEWTVVDDSDDGGVTLARLARIAATEPRLQIHPCFRRSGKIGEVKRRACALSRGEILVELDHDDELTPNALDDIVEAFASDPELGFAYSDGAEVSEETGSPLRYPDGWAFGHGRYRSEIYRGRELLVAVAPPINADTIRHIVGVPNHVRAWRTSSYWQIGGHNPDLHVADDYELLVRTFLQSSMVRIPKLCYIQYLQSGTNTQDLRRAEIQRLVQSIAAFYESRIQTRLEELGLSAPSTR
jgi:glycosyltransferase involved in cell wall biosynthesis